MPINYSWTTTSALVAPDFMLHPGTLIAPEPLCAVMNRTSASEGRPVAGSKNGATLRLFLCSSDLIRRGLWVRGHERLQALDDEGFLSHIIAFQYSDKR